MKKEKTILIEVCRGVVENVYNLPNNYNYEIKLSEELASKVYDYIEKLKEDDKNILSSNTEGKILW